LVAVNSITAQLSNNLTGASTTGSPSTPTSISTTGSPSTPTSISTTAAAATTGAPAQTAQTSTPTAATPPPPALSANVTKKFIDFEAAKNDIIRNIKAQYAILHNLTTEFKSVFKNETAYAEGAYKNLTNNIGYYFSDPDDSETNELDRSLNRFYPFGGPESDYIDTIEKMNEYCSKVDSRLDALKSWIRRKYSKVDSRLDALKSWIRRKYRYNMAVQVSLNLILGTIHEKNEYFCNATAHKEDYINSMKKVRESAPKLIPYKEKLLDTAVFIQNSTFQLPKIGRLCCAFWDFYRGIKNEVKSSQGVDFAVDMTYDYFAGASKYICFLYPYGSELCKEEEKAPKMAHKHQSLVLETLLTLGEIATP
ncbi:unnamed protein product, partial [Oppiella nova]